MSIEVAQGLFEAGRAHAMSSILLHNAAVQRAIDEEKPDPDKFAFNGTYSISIYYLVCIGLELYLKAAYVHYSGDGSHKALHAIGHDLIAALDEAEKHGFQSAVENLREIADLLRLPHLKHYFRYNTPTEVPLPEIAGVIAAIQIIDDELQPLLFPK